jgi:hypothetical protein
MQQILERLEQRLTAGSEVPLEYAGRNGAAAAVALRGDVSRFGSLLEAWPQIRSAAEGMTGYGQGGSG